MTTHNTGNPVPSAAVKDLYDNAENLDAAINGTGLNWTDRLGVVRESWAGFKVVFDQFIAAGSTMEFPTWAAASSAAGGGQIPLNRQVAVIGDTGTHTDPVAGGTVPNSGRFVMVAAGLQFRSADVLSQKADLTTVALQRARTEGITDIERSPNLFLDSFYARLVSGAGESSNDGIFGGTAGGATAVVDPQGRPSVRIAVASAQRYWRIPLAYLGAVAGEKVSAAIRVFDRQGAGSSARLIVKNLTAAFAEINRQEVAIPGLASGQEFVAQVPGFVVDASAAFIELAVLNAGSTNALSFTDVLVAKGLNPDFRPSVTYAKQAALATLNRAVDLTFSAPNLIDNNWAKTVALGAGDAVRVPEVRNGYSAVRVDRTSGAEWRLQIPRDRFGATFSVAGTLVDATNTSARRLMVMQRNAGAEIAGTRVTLQPANNNGLPLRVSQDNVGIHPDCTVVELYISGGSAGTGSSAWWADVVLASGDSSLYRPYSGIPASPSGGLVFVGPAGSDGNAGTRLLPFATPNAAIAALGGVGTVVVLPGIYGPSFKINPAIVKDVQVLGLWSAGAVPLVRCVNKLIGITKTAGRSKVYQATVPGLVLSSLNWVWQGGVADARTSIAAVDRKPWHRGRTNRLPNTKIVKATDTSSIEAALAELDAAADPRCYYQDGVLYFTVAAGGDGTAADIYVSGAGVVPTANIGTAGKLDVVGLEIHYGGINLRPFLRSHLDEVFVYGAVENCVDYAGYQSFGTLEVGGAGDQAGTIGDGLNGHSWAVCVGQDFYGHDCRDEGESTHEYGTVRIARSYVEFNGNSGIAVANGCDAVYGSVQSRGNGKCAVEATNAPTDNGVDTRVLVLGGVSIGDAGGIRGNPAQSCFAEAVDFKVYDCVGNAYEQMTIYDCKHAGTGTPKGPGVTVRNTTLVA